MAKKAKFKRSKSTKLNVSKDCPVAIPDENLKMHKEMRKEMEKNSYGVDIYKNKK